MMKPLILHFVFLFIVVVVVAFFVVADGLPSNNNKPNRNGNNDEHATSAVVRCVDNTKLNIWSPQFGGNRLYPANLARTWTFIATDTTKCISISFSVFDLEDSANCSKDNVRIFDGASPSTDRPIGERLCGKLDGTKFLALSSRHAVSLVFRSDSTAQRRGFSAAIAPVACQPPPSEAPLPSSSDQTNNIPRCFGDTSDSSNSSINIVIVKYPSSSSSSSSSNSSSDDYYPANDDKHWSFVAAAPRTCIEIAIKHFDIERSKDCAKDFVGVFDGPDAGNSSKQLMRMCGASRAYERSTGGKLPVVLSSKNSATLVFHSDAEINRSGFEASITTRACRQINGIGKKHHSSGQGLLAVATKTSVLVPPMEIVTLPKCGSPVFDPVLTGIAKGIDERIVGGSVVRPHSWPWQASIRFRGDHTCGGTLISPLHVLSAAHCFKWLSVDELEYDVLLGKHSTETSETGKAQRFEVEAIIMHPGYQTNTTYDFDVAILRLAPPGAQPTIYVQPICLPWLPKLLVADSGFPSIGESCVVTGFGLTEGTGGENMLKQAEIPVVSMERCRIWNAKLQQHLTDNMVCAGFEEGIHDSCQGDSGGPLSCHRNGTWWLGGIVSFGIDCGQGKSPGVYVRVSNFLKWIEETAFDLVLP